MSTKPNRRVFLRRSAAAIAAGHLGASHPELGLAVATENPLRPCPDDRWRKNRTILADPPGGAHLSNFTCATDLLPDGGWRIWHSTTGRKVPMNIGFAETNLDGRPAKYRLAKLSAGDPADADFAIGNLPLGWRPFQVVHMRLRNGKHRIYFWAHGPKVVRYLAAESDDGRRYRVLNPHRACLYHPNDRAVEGEQAAEAGLLRLADRVSRRPPKEPAAPARLISNDATNVYQLPDGRFEMYSVALMEVPKDDPRYIAHDNVPGWVRVVDRYESEDGLDWTGRQRVLAPDKNDPADQQFYHLAVTHTPQGRVGMLGHYRVEAQTMDIEWCFSKDGVRWERPLRQPWIRRGEPGQPDSYGIYPPQTLIVRDSRWHLFYTGVNYAHNSKQAHGPPKQTLLWASCDSIWA